MKKRKNSTFTIIIFIVIFGLLALCVYGILSGLGITNSDDKKPSATTAPTVSSSAVKEDDSTGSSDSAKKDDADSSESKTRAGDDSEKDGKTDGSGHSGNAQSKPQPKANQNSSNSDGLSEQEATGEDNEISFDDFQ